MRLGPCKSNLMTPKHLKQLADLSSQRTRAPPPDWRLALTTAGFKHFTSTIRVFKTGTELVVETNALAKTTTASQFAREITVAKCWLKNWSVTCLCEKHLAGYAFSADGLQLRVEFDAGALPHASTWHGKFGRWHFFCAMDTFDQMSTCLKAYMFASPS